MKFIYDNTERRRVFAEQRAYHQLGKLAFLKENALYEIAKINPEMPAINIAIINTLPVDIVLMMLERMKENLPNSTQFVGT